MHTLESLLDSFAFHQRGSNEESHDDVVHRVRERYLDSKKEYIEAGLFRLAAECHVNWVNTRLDPFMFVGSGMRQWDEEERIDRMERFLRKKYDRR